MNNFINEKMKKMTTIALMALMALTAKAQNPVV